MATTVTVFGKVQLRAGATGDSTFQSNQALTVAELKAFASAHESHVDKRATPWGRWVPAGF